MESFAKFWIEVFDNFYKTVIFEQRYELILNGLKNTLIMSIGAIILGSLLGIIISLIKHNYKINGKMKILNKICNTYISIIRGTPVLLQLMIIYYIIFKTSTINPIIIGILAFGINSGAYSAEIFRSGLESIDKGQLEAGLSLGFNYPKTMKYIILPQALKNSLPSICNEFITLIKETSVAGYIGIMELTKVSDIIASKTYNYFFPLIIIAVIYFLITNLLSKIFKKVERKLDINDNNKESI